MSEMISYSVEELDALPLLALERKGKVYAYVDLEHPQLDENTTLDKFFDRLALPENWSDSHMVVRICSSSVKRGDKKCFFPLNRFPVSVDKNGKATWETSVRDARLAHEQEQRKAFRALNMQVVRMYVTGSTSGRILCPRYKFELDEVLENGNVFNNWVQHHFRFVKGNSVHKENADPGAILSSYDFTQVTPRSREGIKDMARTIFLSASYHDLIHKARRDGDITDYTVEQLPWALRCEGNWIAFNAYLGQFGHDPLGDYQTWFDEQKN